MELKEEIKSYQPFWDLVLDHENPYDICSCKRDDAKEDIPLFDILEISEDLCFRFNHDIIERLSDLVWVEGKVNNHNLSTLLEHYSKKNFEFWYKDFTCTNDALSHSFNSDNKLAYIKPNQKLRKEMKGNINIYEMDHHGMNKLQRNVNNIRNCGNYTDLDPDERFRRLFEVPFQSAKEVNIVDSFHFQNGDAYYFFKYVINCVKNSKWKKDEDKKLIINIYMRKPDSQAIANIIKTKKNIDDENCGIDLKIFGFNTDELKYRDRYWLFDQHCVFHFGHPNSFYSEDILEQNAAIFNPQKYIKITNYINNHSTEIKDF